MSEYSYDFSIIIPIYNCAEYIDECIKSILKQDYPKEKIQIICVNDGSTDESIDKLNQYRHQITIIDKKNTGVSDTRNQGIALAKGKYLLFLDADDFISPNTCRIIFAFFEKHYEHTDVVVYPRYSYDNKTKITKLLPRFKNYKQTGIYDLNKNYALYNPTLNIATKNMFENNVLFDPNFSFHEDEKYTVELFSKKMTVGYVEEPIYYYRIHETSTTSLKAKPYYCYEQYMHLYEEFIENYTQNGKLLPFIQYSIFNDIKWRIRSNAFFPKHYDEKEYLEETKRIQKIMDAIDENLLIHDVTSSIYYKMYYLKRFKPGSLSVTWQKNCYEIRYNDQPIFYNNSVELTFYRYHIQEDQLQIVAAVKVPFEGLQEYEVYEKIQYRGKKEQIRLLDTQKIALETFENNQPGIDGCYFERHYDRKELIKFSYFLKVGEKELPVTFLFGPNVAFNKSLKRYSLTFGNQTMEVKLQPNIHKVPYIGDIASSKVTLDQLATLKAPNEAIILRPYEWKKDFKTKTKVSLRMLKRSPKEFAQRICMPRQSNIWLYIDRDDKLEEAWIQFQHDMTKNDGIRRYYITSNLKKNPEVKQYGQHVVKRKSYKHKGLYMACSKIITTHCCYGEYKLSLGRHNYYTDKIHYELIFINNKNFKIKTYNELKKNENEIDKIIVSNEGEKKSLIENYYYLDQDIYVCGLPSFDFTSQSLPANKILWKTNWRKFLIRKFNPISLQEDQFEKSVFYQKIKEMMTSKRLKDLLAKNNLTFDIKLDAYFVSFISYLKPFESERIHIVDQVDLTQYKALITDFSSIEYKYLQYNRPILYYLMDLKELNSGFHNFKYYDVEENLLFGDTTISLEKCLNHLEKIIANEFQVKEKYQKRMQEAKIVKNQCREKIYQAVKDVRK